MEVFCLICLAIVKETEPTPRPMGFGVLRLKRYFSDKPRGPTEGRPFLIRTLVVFSSS